MLLLDWPKALWTITWEPEFCQTWDWLQNINSKISFHFRLFPGKLITKFFKKSKKKTICGPFWAFSSKSGRQRSFLEKRTLSVFKYSNYLPSCKKSEKTNDPFLRKMLNWCTDRQADTDGQTNDDSFFFLGNFIEPSVGRGSKNHIFSVKVEK